MQNTFYGVLAANSADGTAIVNSTTEALIVPVFPTPANFLKNFRNLRVVARGRVSNVVTAQPTMRWRLRYGGLGGTLVCDSGALSASASAFTDTIWRVVFDIQIRTNGSSGSLFVIGEGYVGNAATLTPFSMGSAGATVPAAVGSLDFTTASSFALTFQWGTANASNSLQGHLGKLFSED